jgi:hypothetical protein
LLGSQALWWSFCLNRCTNGRAPTGFASGCCSAIRFFPLAYSLFGMLLLTIKPAPDSIWQWCSAFAAVFQVPFAIATFTTPRRFSPDEFKGRAQNLVLSFVCHRDRHPFAATLQHRSAEAVLAVLHRDIRPSPGCDVAVRPARSSSQPVIKW